MIYIVSRMRDIRSLDLCKNFLKSPDLEELNKLKDTTIEELNLSRNLITNFIPNNFFENIKILDLSHNLLMQSALNSLIITLKKPTTKWETINLAYNNLSDINVMNFI